MDVPERFDLCLAGNAVQITQVSHRHPIVIEYVQGIARLFGGAFADAVGLHAGNEHAANLKFARAGDDVILAFNTARHNYARAHRG